MHQRVQNLLTTALTELVVRCALVSCSLHEQKNDLPLSLVIDPSYRRRFQAVSFPIGENGQQICRTALPLRAAVRIFLLLVFRGKV